MTDQKLSESAKAYSRVETRLAIAGEIVRLFENGTISQSDLAERLGVSRARVSKILTAPGNWTLNTIADLLAGMDARLTKVEAKPRSEIAQPNSRHDWLNASDVVLALPGTSTRLLVMKDETKRPTSTRPMIKFEQVFVR